ncbi:MAG: AI-2E family transporter [Clostridia bacterium]|nr:AI-2E family transporter [Clostridia bacterium]
MFKVKWKPLATIGAFILAVYLCIQYWDSIAGIFSKFISATTPIVIGLVTAYIVNILMSFYERHYFPNSKKKAATKTRRPVCMLSAMLTLFGIIALVIGLIAPQLVKCIMLLAEELPGAIETFIPKLEKIGIIPDNVIISLESVNWKSLVSTFISNIDWKSDFISNLAPGLSSAVNTAFLAVSSLVSGIANVVIGIIFAIYLLLYKDKLVAQLKRLVKRIVPENKLDTINYVRAEVSDCFHSFIVGQCTEAVILGVLCMAGMFILRIPYAPMIGALMGFTALIPIVGGLIGAGIGAFLILMESPVKALIFIIFVIILQQIEGNFIYPKIVGKSLDLPGIWVLAAVTVSGGVMGIGGMLIGVPLTAAAYRLLKAYANSPKGQNPLTGKTK